MSSAPKLPGGGPLHFHLRANPLQLPALLGELPPLMVGFALLLAQLQLFQAAQVPVSATVLHRLVLLQVPPCLGCVGNNGARRSMGVWKDPNGLRTCLRTGCQGQDCQQDQGCESRVHGDSLQADAKRAAPGERVSRLYVGNATGAAVRGIDIDRGPTSIDPQGMVTRAGDRRSLSLRSGIHN